MKTILTHCPRCKEKIKGPELAPGEQAQCPSCLQNFTPVVEQTFDDAAPQPDSTRRDAAYFLFLSNICLALGPIIWIFFQEVTGPVIGQALFVTGLFLRIIAELIRIRATLEK